MQSDEIHIPLSTWLRIWEEAGGESYEPQQLALQVNDLSYLEDIVLELQQTFPEFTFHSVTRLVDRAQRNLHLEQLSMVAQEPRLAQHIKLPPAMEQPALAFDLRLPMTILIFINAALVIASNLLIMVSERRTEIGILKAVGSTRPDVIQMVLSEALLISVFGSLIGFVVFRVPAIFTQLSNKVPFAALSGDVLRDLAMVLSIAVVSSLIFGMLPATVMANLSVREVLQTE